MSTAQLVNESTGQIFALGLEPMTLGRHADNDIVMSDGRVSRHHAEIVVQGSRWILRDLDSANGTFVNGERIAGPRVLNPGDIIGLGQTTFRVELHTPLTEQDTLVERLPPVAPVPGAQRGTPWLAVGLALGAVAVVLVGALILWPLLRRSANQPPTATPPPTTSPEPTTTVVAVVSPAVTVAPDRPGDTPIPTIAPPTIGPTRPPATAALPAVVTPAPTPVIGFFRAERLTIQPGECTRLAWGDLENTNSVTLSDVGRVNFGGKIDVCPNASKTYTLRAAGTGGATEESVQVTVAPAPGPAIEYFRVVPSIIAPGDCAQLEWGKVEQSVSAVIEPDLGGVGTPGSATVCPGSTTTYVLTAENPEGSRTAQTTLVISTEPGQKPVIAFFTANPANIHAGECTTLEWGKVDYAAFVSIDQNLGGMGTPGSKEVCLGRTTTFLMTAVGLGGTTESRLTVDVSPGELAELPDLVIESLVFAPNPCYQRQKCKLRLTVRNDGPVDAGHFVVRWAPSGEEAIPVEWDVAFLGAGQETELTYPWIPSQVNEQWWTLAIVDLNDEVAEIEEGPGNILEQYVTVRQPAR